MIARLSGTLAAKAPGVLVVDVGGVGYEVLVSLQSFYRLPEPGGKVTLAIHTHVREDAMQLFGFLDAAERVLFLQLIGISGIGPKLALNILSGQPAAELGGAIEAGDVARLVAIPGVGKKTAERIVLELREKVKAAGAGAGAAAPAARPDNEAVSALVNLGYRQADAERGVRAARDGGAAAIEDVIREALKRLSA